MRDGRTRKICVTAKILAELIVSANAYGKFDQKNVLRVIYGMMSDYNSKSFPTAEKHPNKPCRSLYKNYSTVKMVSVSW